MSEGPGHSSEDNPTFADVLDGFALGPRRGRRKRKKDRDEPREQDSREPPGTQVPAMPVAGEEQHVSAEAIPLHPEEEVGTFLGTGDMADTGFVRPYAITGGRTKANYPLELETLISTRETAVMAVPDQFEHRQIMEKCRTPHSVAEVAADLGVPLGVARVLISDAADAGLVNVHKTISGDEGAEAHLMLMERVLSGLRRL